MPGNISYFKGAPDIFRCDNTTILGKLTCSHTPYPKVKRFNCLHKLSYAYPFAFCVHMYKENKSQVITSMNTYRYLNIPSCT